MNTPIVYGASYSVYVRVVRMTLVEKSENYELQEIDIFAERLPTDYIDRHPFNRIPAFEHDGFALYETAAITRYIDDTYPTPPLTPSNIQYRARMNQIISILDNYAYPAWVWGLYVETVSKPEEGAPSDQGKIDAAIENSRKCAQAISELHPGKGLFLTGDMFTLADVYAIPMYLYLTMTDQGQELVNNLFWHQWWNSVKSRKSVTMTSYPRENN